MSTITRLGIWAGDSTSKLSEFSFNHCNRGLCTGFLEALGPYDFFYRGIVIDRAKLWSPGFHYKASIYKYASSLVFENAKPYLNDAGVGAAKKSV